MADIPLKSYPYLARCGAMLKREEGDDGMFFRK
jgi:hypothetical protein